MTDQTPPVDEMQYERLAHEALRGVIRSALDHVLAEGLPGAHHFYITFKTRAAGVSIPPDMLAKYPQVEADRFSVKLRFGGVPRTLAMPYSAVTRFYDPSVQFLLQFDEPEIVEAVEEATPPEDPTPGSDGPKVVSLDQFRKK
jgi:hypothetical protein